MKIKDWLSAIASLGDDDAIIGGIRQYNGQTYYDLTLTSDLGNDELYDCTPENGN
jgi:hypothetical protein